MVWSADAVAASFCIAVLSAVASAAPAPATAPAVPPVTPAIAKPAAATRPTAPEPPTRVVATEMLLYRIPPGVKVADTTASPDARHVICVESRPKADADGASRARRYAVSLDGRGGADHEWIVGRSLAFSPDGSRFTYRVAEGGKVFAVIGDVAASEGVGPQSGKPYFMAGPMTFSPDGKRWAHRARPEQGGGALMVIDGKEGESFDAPNLAEELSDDAETVFSKNGRRLAYRARRAGGKQAFVIDGAVGPWCDAVRGLLFSDDGNRVAYLAKAVDAGKDQFFVVIDGKEGKRYDSVAGLAMTPDGRRWAYAAGKGGKQLLVANDVEYRPYDAMGDLAFSPDGRRLAMTARTGDRWTAIIDGKEGPAYDGVGRIYFSPDSRHVAYVAGQSRKQFAVIDGVPGPPFSGVGAVLFAPVGGRAAYGATSGRDRLLIIDGKPLGNVGLFAFSPDGRRLAHAVPRRLAADAPAGAERWTLAVEGVEAGRAAGGPSTAPTVEYDGFPLGARMVFDASGVARIVAGRGKELFLVDVRAE